MHHFFVEPSRISDRSVVITGEDVTILNATHH